MKRSFAALSALLLLSVESHAQQAVEMADLWHRNGKIYVVILVLATIFAGILVFLINLERRLGRLEKNEPTLLQ